MGLDSRLLAALFLVSMASPSFAAEPSALKALYEGKQWVLQYNLRFSDGETSCVNFMGQGDYLPIGTIVTLKKVKPRAVVLAMGQDGKSRLELDLSDCLPQSAEILKRLLGSEPPTSDGLNEEDLKGIKVAKVGIGMTRQGVFRAIGYPPWHYSPTFFGDKKSATNHALDSDELTYMASAYDFVTIRFEADVVVGIDD